MSLCPRGQLSQQCIVMRSIACLARPKRSGSDWFRSGRIMTSFHPGICVIIIWRQLKKDSGYIKITMKHSNNFAIATAGRGGEKIKN